MAGDREKAGSRWKRLGWFVAIWLGSVAALGLAAYAMRFFMRLAGMSPP